MRALEYYSVLVHLSRPNPSPFVCAPCAPGPRVPGLSGGRGAPVVQGGYTTAKRDMTL